NWTVGYSSDLVVGVWVGNTDNSPMQQIDGVAGAAPIFHRFMVAAHGDEFGGLLAGPDGQPAPAQFHRPAQVVDVEVCVATGKLPGPGMPTYTDIASIDDRPTTRCDQLTQREDAELRAALNDLTVNGDRYTDDGVASLLRYAEA